MRGPSNNAEAKIDKNKMSRKGEDECLHPDDFTTTEKNISHNELVENMEVKINSNNPSKCCWDY